MITSDDLERAVVSVVGQGRMAQPVFVDDEDVGFPYARLMPDRAETVRATDRTWIWHVPYFVFLCTRYRNRALEVQMASALDDAGIGFELEWDYDAEERVFLTVFHTDPVVESILPNL